MPNETVRCVLAALHSYTHTTWIRVWGSGSLVTCGVKMMSLHHGWGWQPPQTAFHIHIRHMQCVWAHWHAVHWHTSAVLHSFTHTTWLRFWVGVALVKPTTSYFWFLVTFHHNRICGLAVAFKNYFLRCLPALLKIIPKTGDVCKLHPNANNVIRPPPPIPPPWCNDSTCIYSLVTNQAMQSHRDNTHAWNCIAWFLPWVDFHVKIVRHTMHDAMIFILFSVAAQYWPSPSPNLVEIVRPLARPFSQRHMP